MTTSLVVRTDISGTTYSLDVSALELTPSLSTLDYEVTHNGTIVSNLYAKTSSTLLSYSGTNVTLGTKIVARRLTSVVQSETTFLSTTTASALTNALEKERLRIDELDARLSYTLAQVALGGVSIGSIPINNAAYGAGWSGDTNNAPSKNTVYNKIQATDTAVASKADAAATSASLALLAPINNPTLTGDPKSVTPATNDNDTSIATTAYVKAQHPAIVVSGNERSVLLPNGLLMKYGTVVVTIATNSGSYTFVTTPAFGAVISLVVSNGDSSVSTSLANVQAFNTTGFTVNTPSYASGSYRVNFIMLGT